MNKISGESFTDNLIVAKECIKRYTQNYAIFAFVIINTVFLSMIIYDNLHHITTSEIDIIFSPIETIMGMLTTSLVISAFMIIAVTVNEFSAEIEKKTLPILLTTPISRRNIFFGKIMGIMFIPLISVFLNLIYTLILTIVTGLFPGFIIAQYIKLLVLFLLCSLAICGVSVCVSLATKKSILSIMILIGYLLGTFIMSATVSYTYESPMQQSAYYNVDYLSILPFPLITFAMSSNSLQATGSVDPYLITVGIIFSVLTLFCGYLLLRRLEV